MLGLLIGAFLILLLIGGYFIIRFVPDDCRLLVERKGQLLVMKPGLDFLIPFSDKEIGIIQIAYKDQLLCDFVYDEEACNLVGSYSIISEEQLNSGSVAVFEQIPSFLSSQLQTFLQQQIHQQEHLNWQDVADQILVIANIHFKDLNVRIDNLVIKVLDADELRSKHEKSL